MPPLHQIGSELDQQWLLKMRRTWEAGMRYKPNYYLNQPEMLQADAIIHDFVLGTGATLIDELATAIEKTQTELIFITCFWAESASLESVRRSLRRLSDQVIRDQRSPVKVFIGFSSLSLMQKLFQTSSAEGRLYPASEWTKKLGLPHASHLPGLNITIKSIFVRPFSVMHPKFVIIDREVVWLPSCNVSWETWFEGVVVMSGPIVEQFVKFWKEFWLLGQTNWPDISARSNLNAHGAAGGFPTNTISSSRLSTQSLFLPSPHHPYSLCIPFLMSTSSKPPPPTPLTNFLMTAIQTARSQIHIQTPNLTAFVVIQELLRASQNGIDIDITTSEKLMVLEQLVTAGSTTKKAVNWFIAEHRRLQRSTTGNPEAGIAFGRLRISFFRRHERAHATDAVQTHIKLTIVDQETVILGSQNLDRASWFTSQELGVAFKSKEFAQQVRSKLDAAMDGKSRLIYDSSDQNWSPDQ